MKIAQVAFLLALTISNSFAATGCVLIGSPSTKVELQGKISTLPLRLANCEGVKVVFGPVTACYVDKTQQRACRQLNQGQTFAAESLGTMEGAGTAAFQATLMTMLLGDTHAPAGGTRSADKVNGLPYANVLGRNDQIVIATKPQELKEDEIVDFELTEDNAGAETKKFKPRNGSISIPTNLLTRGLTYSWDAHTRKKTYSGTFHLASDDRVVALKKIEATIMNPMNADPFGEKILLAEKYFDNGFSFDAIQILQELFH